MSAAPVLVPGETEYRFLVGDATHDRERFPIRSRPGPWGISGASRVYGVIDYFVVDRREFQSHELGRVVIFCTAAEQDRCLTMLRCIRHVLRFFAAVALIHEEAAR